MMELAHNLMAAGLVPCGGAGEDPCTYADFFILINNVLQFLVYLAVPVGTIAIVAAGILFAASAGNEKYRETAKSIIWTAVKGLVLVLAAYLIISTIVNVLGNPDVVQL